MDVRAGARRIAIWNKNRAVVAITTCAWGISGACIIQGNSILFPLMIWNSPQSDFISRREGNTQISVFLTFRAHV